MRLSHWDFRPKQRRKYVAAGPPDGRNGRPGRRQPALRILLLFAAGGIVYLKYDDVIRSPALQNLRHPERLWEAARDRIRTRLPLAAPKTPAVASVDDAGAERLAWSCASAARDSCLEAWDLPSDKARGAIRAALHRAQSRAGFPAPGTFTAEFRRASPEADAWALSRVTLVAGERSLTWAALPDRAGVLRWCVPGPVDPGHCPAEAPPRPPARRIAAVDVRGGRPPVLAFRIPPGEPVRPVLPGRILDLPRGPGDWLKVHHGGTTFSYYAGLARLRPGLAAGQPVVPEDTLGYADPAAEPAATAFPGMPGAAPAADTLAAHAGTLLLRIEQDGSPSDPQAFLGLETAVAAGPGGGVPDAR